MFGASAGACDRGWAAPDLALIGIGLLRRRRARFIFRLSADWRWRRERVVQPPHGGGWGHPEASAAEWGRGAGAVAAADRGGGASGGVSQDGACSRTVAFEQSRHRASSAALDAIEHVASTTRPTHTVIPSPSNRRWNRAGWRGAPHGRAPRSRRRCLGPAEKPESLGMSCSDHDVKSSPTGFNQSGLDRGTRSPRYGAVLTRWTFRGRGRGSKGVAGHRAQYPLPPGGYDRDELPNRPALL